MKAVFVLQHSYEIDDFENTKMIGVYSSEAKAKEVVERYRVLPGFRDYPDCFNIDKYELDKDHWEEGFIKWDEAYSDKVD